MPIYEFMCGQCGVIEKILPVGHTISKCDEGHKVDPMLSVPGKVRVAGEGVANPRSERIRDEPVWRDLKTGKVESMY